MLRNILKLTFRNLYKNSLYTGINILGLMIGLSVFLGILALVMYENEFNRDISGSDRIYRIYTEYTGAFSGTNRGVSNGVPAYLEDNFPFLENVAQLHTWSAGTQIPQGDGSLKDMERQGELVIAGISLFEIIDIWHWESGDPASLERPNVVVLLRSQAEKYFGDLPSSEYLGREVIYQDSLSAEVVGIVTDPEKTDFIFTDFISMATIEASFLKSRWSHTDWSGTSSSDQVFIKLSAEATATDLEYMLAKTNEERDSRNDDTSFQAAFKAQPLAELHYDTELGVFDNVSHAANRSLLRNIMLIAIAILIIAIVNFINLETAIGGKRGREIGIRKVFGSTRTTVILQFMVQSVIMTFAAIILAVPLTRAGMILFSDFLPDGVSFTPFETTNLVLLLLIGLTVGIISGFYPALVMSSYSPVNVLKSNMPTTSGIKSSGWLRKGLTLFQFTFSQVLLIVTLVIINQIDFMINKDLGFETENIIYFSTPYYTPDSKREVLHNELESISGIAEITRFSSAPIESGWSSMIVGVREEDGTLADAEVFIKSGDSTYTDFFGIKQISGRQLRLENEILINETLMREMGYDNPVDVLDVMLDPDDDSLIVAGVIQDFHFRPLQNEIKPMAIKLDKGVQFAVKPQDEADPEQVISAISGSFSKVYPDITFSHQYFNNRIEQFYESEQRTSKLVTAAAGLALLISCMGLFGLSSYMAIQRTKEIGIRKVQGATVRNIIRLLTTDFLKLVLIAVVIAVPLAWFAGESWLEEYAYKAPVDISLYFLAGGIALIIAFMTVSYHALTAAWVNPVSSLRTE